MYFWFNVKEQENEENTIVCIGTVVNCTCGC
jgi:hypothetical protein